MKKLLLSLGISVLIVAIALGGVSAWAGSLSDYPPALGNTNDTEKITGEILVKTAAADPKTVTIYGSSELRTTDISTHPSNFFAGERAGFQINLVGRGSCQSIIHALSIAASGEALGGTKVVLITSPQSFVEGGIAPDLFMANFSEQQYLTIMSDKTIPDAIKIRFSERIDELLAEYNTSVGKEGADLSASALVAKSCVDKNAILSAFTSPYAAASRWLLEVRDGASAKRLIASTEFSEIEAKSSEIDWDAELEAAVAEARSMTSNNEFGILNDYYNTYIGRKLAQQKDKDAELSYSVSKEYDDLRLLLDVCALKGIEPLFVHVPLHGEWSDYTGFSAERREEYYQNVREIVGEYENVTLLDLTGYEYEEYFLCDIMHLGWKGWLEVDKALVEYYNKN